MAFKLAIGDVLDVVVKGTVKDAATPVAFNFTLQMKRLPHARVVAVLNPDNGVLVHDFLTENVQGWRGQRLVLDEQDQPAEFSPEAFDCLLTLVGMEQTCFNAYMHTLQVAETAAGRRGN